MQFISIWKSPYNIELTKNFTIKDSEIQRSNPFQDLTRYPIFQRCRPSFAAVTILKLQGLKAMSKFFAHSMYLTKGNIQP